MKERTFVYRHKPDHTIDSICTNCFATVATEKTLRLLKEAEDIHRCSNHPGNRFEQ